MSSRSVSRRIMTGLTGGQNDLQIARKRGKDSLRAASAEKHHIHGNAEGISRHPRLRIGDLCRAPAGWAIDTAGLLSVTECRLDILRTGIHPRIVRTAAGHLRS